MKSFFTAACLALGLAFAAPAICSGPGSDVSVVMAADGWQQDETGWYYLQGDQKLIGSQTINGYTYYFNQYGYRQTGTVFMDGTAYFFNPENGKLCTGYAGMAKLSSTTDYYYFLNSKNGAIAVNRWVTHKGKKYYAGSDGKIQFGTVKIKNKLYHLTPNGRMTSYGKSSYDGKYYYATAKGTLKTGLQVINGKRYFFNQNTGVRQTGRIKIGNSTYYFGPKTGASATGWKKLNGKYYYFSKKNGELLTGLKVIGKSKYYLDPSIQGARAENRWVKYKNNSYYFNSSGKCVKGLFKLPNGKVYYSNSKGIRQTGWQTIGGRKYYFTPSSGVMKTGWFNYRGKTYYLNSSTKSKYYGAAVTGWAIIGTETYYFNNDGTLKKGCWIYDANSKAYYYLGNITGKVLKGNQKINGVWYDLGTTGAYKKALTGDYLIKVNRALNCITVYRGGVPIKAFVCSTSRVWGKTPSGTFKLLDKLRWHELMGPSWGQYCSHITGDILFHSVPCTRYRDNHSLEYWEYNKLGQAASAGCIRMTVADAKWLYDNCPIGTKVIIYDDWNSPGPLGKPSAPGAPNWTKSYDPTDPYA